MSDRLAVIVRAILKDKFIRAIGERKWTAQDEESINKLSDFFTEFDQRLTALEGGATKKDTYGDPDDKSWHYVHCNLDRSKPRDQCTTCKEEDAKPAPTTATVDGYPINKDEQQPATVERFKVYRFRPIDASRYQRDHIGAVGARAIHNGGGEAWAVTICGVEFIFSLSEYRALVDMMLKSGVWEKMQ